MNGRERRNKIIQMLSESSEVALRSQAAEKKIKMDEKELEMQEEVLEEATK